MSVSRQQGIRYCECVLVCYNSKQCCFMCMCIRGERGLSCTSSELLPQHGIFRSHRGRIRSSHGYIDPVFRWAAFSHVILRWPMDMHAQGSAMHLHQAGMCETTLQRPCLLQQDCKLPHPATNCICDHMTRAPGASVVWSQCSAMMSGYLQARLLVLG